MTMDDLYAIECFEFLRSCFFYFDCCSAKLHPISYESEQPSRVNGRSGPQVEILDIGCGFGGLMMRLGPEFPETLMMGMEIRERVTNYVGEKIWALRANNRKSKSGAVPAEGGATAGGVDDGGSAASVQAKPPPGAQLDSDPRSSLPGLYDNVTVIRTNAMKYLPNYFRRGQISKIFICFPDPQFKKKHLRRRIINTSLLPLYAFLLKEQGILYAITDLEFLYNWHEKVLTASPLFEKVDYENELKDDPCIDAIKHSTEEGHKATREGRGGFISIYRRVSDESVILKQATKIQQASEVIV
eukprot:GHVU01211999.1.p1 GENE.GHVU01211999.1~~GHVU01211999.1.p1  ORF type:complete len:300 (-),score=40.57 GHVU01211999.1:368-1267(-)